MTKEPSNQNDENLLHSNNNNIDVTSPWPSITTSPSTNPDKKIGTVVMIHGWAQNSHVMQIKTKTLTRKLNQSGYDCIFPNAPHILPTQSTITIDGRPVVIDNGKRKNARAWFLYSSVDHADASASQNEALMAYVGVDESLEYLRTVLCEIRKRDTGGGGGSGEGICALFGFSQGAVFVHLVSSIMVDDNNDGGRSGGEDDNDDFEGVVAYDQSRRDSLGDVVKCVILVGGFRAMHDGEGKIKTTVRSNTAARHEGLTLPSLHVIGERDTSVPPALSRKLVRCYDDPEEMIHEKGHVIPQRSADCQRIIDFLRRYCKSK